MNSIKREVIGFTIAILVIISLWGGWLIFAEPYLDSVFNQPGAKDKTTNGEEPRLRLLSKEDGDSLQRHYTEISLTKDGMQVFYSIPGTSLEEGQEHFDLVIATIDSDPISDQRNIIWNLLRDKKFKDNVHESSSNGSYQIDFFIDGKYLNRFSEYFINIYFKGELVRQYKVTD